MKNKINQYFADESMSPIECVLCAVLFGAAFFSPFIPWLFS